MRISDIFLNLFSSGKERDCVMATTHEQIAGDICVQIGHLPESAKDKILKLVVAKALPGKAVYVSRKKEVPFRKGGVVHLMENAARNVKRNYDRT